MCLLVDGVKILVHLKRLVRFAVRVLAKIISIDCGYLKKKKTHTHKKNE